MKNNKNKKIDIYERDGVYGDAKNFTSDNLRLRHMVKFIQTLDQKPERVLDIGCGTGSFANIIKNTYPDADIYGLDVSKKALSIAEKKYPSIKFINVDAELKLPFKNNYFQLIISGENIEHIRDVDTYLIEIHRTLKKNGSLILTTPNLGSWLNRFLLLFGLQPFYLEPSLRKTFPILSYFGKTFPEDLESPPSEHLRLYTLNMLKKLVNFYGFTLTEVKGTEILKGLILKQVDSFFSNFPTLSYGLVLKLKKI